MVSERRFFQVISRSLLSKKFVITESLARLKSMRVPLVLQRLALEDAARQLSESVVAVPEGSPAVRDVRQLGAGATFGIT